MKEFTEEEVQEKRTKVEKTKKQGPANGADTQSGSVQTKISKEKGLRAWLTRNAVAFCTFFIGVFSVMQLSALAQFELSEFFIGPLLCLSASLPLILIRTDHWIMRLAGWAGVLSWGFIILLYLIGITPQHRRDGDFYWYLTGVYFLNTVILGVMARKGAVRKRKVVPRWEQRIRDWASRNVVAYSNALILFLLSCNLCLYFHLAANTGQALENWFWGIIISSISLILVSIPLILSEKGGQIMANAGWLGVFWCPSALIIDLLIDPDRTTINFTIIVCLGIYTLMAIALAYYGRRKAKKELSEG